MNNDNTLFKKILLVEDNPDDILLTLRALKKNNILNDVIVAKDGVEALNILFGSESTNKAKGLDNPILILLDIKLPRMDGLEVLRKIRENDRTKLIPVVILTSSREDNDIADSYRMGVNAYVRKPVDFIEFTEAVRQIGLFWLLLNEAPLKPRGDLHV